MLKKRIIPVQLLLDGRLVKTVKFGTWRDVGDPVKSSAVYNSQYADELVFLNIARDDRTIDMLREVIERVSEVSFMPMAMGGGIRTPEDAAELIRTGADKVVINSVLYVDRSSPPPPNASALRPSLSASMLAGTRSSNAINCGPIVDGCARTSR